MSILVDSADIKFSFSVDRVKKSTHLKGEEYLKIPRHKAKNSRVTHTRHTT